MGQGWERLAARSGGTVAALATAPGGDDGPAAVFAATATGLHRSVDGGATWAPTGESSSAPFAEAIALSPDYAADRTLYAGARNGLYRSADGGATWQQTLTDSHVFAVAAVHDARRTLALFAGTEADGVKRSDDGKTWHEINEGLPDKTVLALAASPQFARDQLAFAATASGISRTRNGGKSWRPVELPLAEPAVQCLALSPTFAGDHLVLAGTEAGGLLRSDDGGNTWQAVPALAGQGVTALAFSTRYASRGALAAATSEGVAVSTDGGASWRLTGQDLGPVLSLAFAPAGDGEALLAGLPGQGVARSTDGGATWEPANDGLHATLLMALALSPAFDQDNTVFAASLEAGLLVSTDGGATFAARNEGLADTSVFRVVASPGYAENRTLFAATGAGVYRSRDGAATWRAVERDGKPLPAGVFALDGATVYLAAPDGQLFVSTDDGETWRDLGQHFGGAEILSLALSPAFERDRTLFVGASKPAAEGAAGLTIWRSTDGGEVWERWLEQPGQRHDVLPLAVPETYATDGGLFVGVGGRVRTPMRHAQEVRDGARRPIWRSVGLGKDATAVTALGLSPEYARDRTLFAASNAGVYVSRDGGQSFARWSEGLSPAQVLGLAVSPRYATDRTVYALGLGGTIWRRRDG